MMLSQRPSKTVVWGFGWIACWAVVSVFDTQAGNAEGPRTMVITAAEVPVSFDSCLDHSVRELGMSAKKRADERVWDIGPQFVHPGIVPEGRLEVRFAKRETTSQIRVAATWPGKTKAPDVQAEIERRLSLMSEKLAQICGVVKPVVACEVTPAGATSSACAPRT